MKINLAGLKFKIEGDFDRVGFDGKDKLLTCKIFIKGCDVDNYEKESDLFEVDFVLTLCGLNFNASLRQFEGGFKTNHLSNLHFEVIGKPFLSTDLADFV